MKKSQIISVAVIVVIIVVVAGAWFVFLKPHATPVNGQSGMASTTRSGFGAMRGGFANGSIEVLNDNGFTLTLADATTKNINLSATTTIQNYASASSTPTTITSDQLSVGEEVSVIGSPNPDGSIDARIVRTGTFPTTMPGRGGYSATSTRQRRPAPAQ